MRGSDGQRRRPAGWVSLWGPVGALIALIFWASSQQALPDVADDLGDKPVHAIVFGVLAILWQRALAGGRWSGVTLRRAILAAAAATAYGLLDEWHQRFVAGRTSELADVLADAMGATLAAAAVWAWGIIHARRQGVRSPPPVSRW